MITTCVRSLVGTTLELPGGKSIRPWAQIELGSLTQDQTDVLGVFLTAKHVSIGQLVDGHPISTINLQKAVI